jgi:urea transport system ATP-binding protein
MSQPTAIYVDELTVEFDGFRAVDNLSFIAEYGGIHGVIGPNGAGKTTLMDVITGITQPSSGTVLLDRAVDVLRMTLPERARAGIGRKFQRPSVFEHLTLRENIALGVRLYPNSLIRELTRGEVAEKHDRVQSVLETIKLDHLADGKAGTLAHGQKQWLEIGMVLAREPKVLMLDEPVAGMSDAEREATADLLERLRSPARCILLVEHDMQFVGRVSDHISVLHEGKLLCDGTMERVTNDPEVIRVYLGR